jgi:hypothetical protein
MKAPLSELSSKVFHFYLDGFRNMSVWGKKVWIIILIKLCIIFMVLKVFFFPDLLKRNYANDEQRSEYILDQLTKSPETND